MCSPRPARTPDEKREYKRGYNRGVKRCYERINHVLALAKSYRIRIATTDERHCNTCVRWLRGDGWNKTDGCKWGSCRADFEFDTEASMMTTDNKVKIITSEEFGCVSWLARSVSALRQAAMGNGT